MELNAGKIRFSIYLMHDTLFNYLSKFKAEPLTEEEKKLVSDSFMPHHLRKKQYLLQAGDHCKYFAFVVKGAMRQYSVDEKGVEHIVHLGVENWWVGDRESWSTGRPSVYYIDAWEPTDALLVSRPSMLNLMQNTSFIYEMMRQLDERNSIANQRRLTSSISASAENKYIDFAGCHPDLLARFPQHIIASYLGMTKDTLSRVKRNMLKK